MTEREDHLLKAEALLSRAESCNGVAANAERAKAYTRMAEAYITLATTPKEYSISGAEWRRPHGFGEPRAEDVYTAHRADTLNSLYGTPESVKDETVSDAPADKRPRDEDGNPFSDNVGHFYVRMRVDAKMNYSDAAELCTELFPLFRVVHLDVSTTSNSEHDITSLEITLGY